MNCISIKQKKMTANCSRRGSTLVEFALVAPLLLFITFGLIQYGIYMNAAVALTNLSREGARFAATQPNSDAGILDRMEDVCPPSIKWKDIEDSTKVPVVHNVVITPAESSTLRVRPNLITVTITYDMKKKMFMPTTFWKWTLVAPIYTAKAVMMVE